MIKWNIFFMVAIAFSGFSQSAQAEADSKLHIGLIYAEAQEGGSLTAQEKHCIFSRMGEMAEAQYTNVEFIVEFNERTAIGASQAAQRLIDRDVDVVLLPLISKEAIPASKVLSEHQIPYITTATSPSVLESGLGLSIMASNDRQAKLLADYMVEQFVNETIGVLSNVSNQYSRSIADSFIQYVASTYPEINTKRIDVIASQVAMVAEQNPEISTYFAPLYNPNIAHFYNSLVNANKNAVVVGPDSIGARSEFFKLIKQSNDRVRLLLIKNWDKVFKGDQVDQFIALQKQHCPNPKPSFVNVYAFDMMNLVIDAISEYQGSELVGDTFVERVTPTAEAFMASVQQTDYVSLMDNANYRFDAKGFNNKPLYLFEIDGTSIKQVKALK